MKKLNFIIFFSIFMFLGCAKPELKDPYIFVLGVAQDGGAPHAGCSKICCIERWNDPKKKLMVASLGIVDPNTNEKWMIDATPDFPKQFEILTGNDQKQLKGIFLTHAHIGHYSGLIHLGREVMGSSAIPVYTMPKMNRFLSNNGPWDQLINLNNINIKKLKDGKQIKLNDQISITPFIVPHRDEYSETVGFKINGPKKSMIYIPDIDKWQKWDQNIVDIINKNDLAMVDGSFYQNGEIPGRDMSEIPHPFIVESMDLMRSIAKNNKIYFIHLNHTNPALVQDSAAQKEIINSGFNIAEFGMILNL